MGEPERCPSRHSLRVSRTCCVMDRLQLLLKEPRGSHPPRPLLLHRLGLPTGDSRLWRDAWTALLWGCREVTEGGVTPEACVCVMTGRTPVCPLLADTCFLGCLGK